MSTTHTNVLKEARQAFCTAFAADTGFPTYVKQTQVIKAMSNIKTVQSRRVLVGGMASPEIIGASIIGWEADLVIQCVSNFNDISEDQHEEICAAVEAFICNINDLPDLLSNTVFKVQVATPGEGPKSDFQDDERVTEYHLILNCLLTGV